MVGDLLFDLIKGMSSSEKSYFSSYVKSNAKKGTPIYWQLFKAIDKMKTYNELALQKVVSKKQLPFQKNYLYQQLIELVGQFNIESGVNETLASNISAIQYFIKKKLWTNAEHVLKRSFKIIDKQSNYINQHYQYQIYTLALQLEQVLPKFEKFNEEIEYLEFLKSKIELLEHNLNELHSLQFAEGWYAIANKKGLLATNNKDDIINKSKQLIESTVNKPLHAEHFNNKSVYLGLNGIYQNFILPKSKKSEGKNYYKERLKLYGQFPLYIQEHPRDYTALVSNILQQAILSHSASDFNYYKKFLERIFSDDKEASKELKFEAKRVYVLNVLIQHCLDDVESVSEKKKVYNDLVPLLVQVQKDWKKYRHEYVHLAYIYYFAVMLTFDSIQYEESASYIQEFLKHHLSSQHKHYILLLRILIFYELEELETSWSFLRSFKRNFKNLMNRSDMVLYFIVKKRVEPKAKANDSYESFKTELAEVNSPLIRKIFTQYLQRI